MSQEQPSQPQTPPEPIQSKTPVKKGVKTAQTTGSQVQSILRNQSIKALRGTIRVLEGVLVKLEAPPASTLPPSATRQPWNTIQSVWSAVLGTIRALLPEKLNQLSNTALTGAITGIAVVLVLTISALSPGKPTDVATSPPSAPTPPANIPTPTELTAPAAPEPIEVTPPPASVIAPVIAPVTAPVTAPTPTPTVELTPEQNLIASIQAQVAEITNKYADGLIQSIQANFPGSRLTVRVSEDWYNIEQSQQNKLASEMLNQAKQLDFSQLELTDLQGKLLARSPVVGTDMIILKRQA